MDLNNLLKHLSEAKEVPLENPVVHKANTVCGEGKDMLYPEQLFEIGSVHVYVWRINSAVIGFKIKEKGSYEEQELNASIQGSCKWDGCYDFHSVEDADGDHCRHYCNIEEWIAAWIFIEKKRLEMIENAE